MAQMTEDQLETSSYEERLECLKDATKRLRAEESAKRRDSKLHTERIKDINTEIDDIMDLLKRVGE